MSVTRRVLVGLALATCVVAGSVMVRSPTGLEKATRARGEPTALPRVPSEAEWLSLSEDELVARVVNDPVKVRGLRSFAPEHQVALKEIMRQTEEIVRSTARSSRASGRVGPQGRDLAERAIAEYSAALERFSLLR